MRTFKLFPTRDTFLIDGDIESGVLKIEGSSYNNNSVGIYEKFLDWSKEFVNESKACSVFLNLNYFNSATERIIYDFLLALKSASLVKPVKVFWSFEPEDEDIKESGEGFREIVGDFIELKELPSAD